MFATQYIEDIGLQAIVDEVVAEDVETLRSGLLADDLVTMRRQIDRLEGEWRRRVREFDRRQHWRVDGAATAAAWLRWRCRMAPGRASRSVKEARALGRMPDAARAFSSGEITQDHASLLVQARDQHPDVYNETEGTLVESAQVLSVRDLRRLIQYWAQNADPEGGEARARRIYDQRRFHASRSLDGAVHIDGLLDPVGGETLLAAIDSAAQPMLRNTADDRTPAQIRADVLVDLLRRSLESGDLPAQAGERPHVTVLVDLAALGGDLGVSELGPARTVVPPSTLDRLVCDSDLIRLITNARGEPIDVGRKQRLVTTAQRRAISVRDRGCRFPGCGRPDPWCDAHHIVPWSAGGRTDADNLVLLCRHHHTLVHGHGFGLSGRQPDLAWTRPDGTPLLERGPPR